MPPPPPEPTRHQPPNRDDEHPENSPRFTTTPSSKRSHLHLRNIVHKDETITGLPTRVPFPRLYRPSRAILGEASKNEYNMQLGAKRDRAGLKHIPKLENPLPPASNVEIWEDHEEVEQQEIPLPYNEISDKENDPPKIIVEKKRTVKISENLDRVTPSSSHRAPSPIAPPEPAEPPPPQSLSNLLLAHSSPRVPPPSIPTPPLSRLHHRFAVPSPAAQPPTPAESTPEPSPLEQMKALRAEFAQFHTEFAQPSLAQPEPEPPSSPPHPSPKRLRPPASSSFASRHAFSLIDLPAMTHHSRAAIINLHPPTHLDLTLRDPSVGGSRYRYCITPAAGPITILDSTTNTETTYDLPDLPWKHLRAYKYARRFVDAIAKRTVVAYGGIEGARGRVWADGRGLFQLEGGAEIELRINRGEDYGTAIIAGTRKLGILLENDRVVPAKESKYTDAIDLAGRVYLWLLHHPSPLEQDVAEDSLKVDSQSVFVKDVGWCRRDSDGRWEMVFVDGVRLEIDANSGDVLWVQDGRKRAIKGGMREKSVRERVRGFVNAGL